MALSKIDVSNMLDETLPVAQGGTGVTSTPFPSNYSPNLNFRNIIINGDMSIAQRATSATTLSHAQYKTIDRWSQNLTSSTLAFTGEQSTDAPSGFDYSYKISCTTAEASLAASSRMMPYYRVEDSNLGYLKFGSSSAVDLTMSFYVKSNKTGTYQINLWHNNVSGYISATYTINSASTWEKKEITFKGDQGTAMGNDAGVGLQLEFVLAGGSNYTGGTFVPNTTTTYPSYVANTRATSQGVNLADSTSNTWQITGLQLEVGSTASDFEFLPHDVNLQRCQRYYELCDGNRVVGTNYNSTALYCNQLRFSVTKRASPTITIQNNVTTFTVFHSGGYDTSQTWNTDQQDVDFFNINMTNTRATGFIGPGDDLFIADAEL
jgi:hypothetical protein